MANKSDPLPTSEKIQDDRVAPLSEVSKSTKKPALLDRRAGRARLARFYFVNAGLQATLMLVLFHSFFSPIVELAEYWPLLWVLMALALGALNLGLRSYPSAVGVVAALQLIPWFGLQLCFFSKLPLFEPQFFVAHIASMLFAGFKNLPNKSDASSSEFGVEESAMIEATLGVAWSIMAMAWLESSSISSTVLYAMSRAALAMVNGILTVVLSLFSGLKDKSGLPTSELVIIMSSYSSVYIMLMVGLISIPASLFD